MDHTGKTMVEFNGDQCVPIERTIAFSKHQEPLTNFQTLANKLWCLKIRKRPSDVPLGVYRVCKTLMGV